MEIEKKIEINIKGLSLKELKLIVSSLEFSSAELEHEVSLATELYTRLRNVLEVAIE